MRIERRLAILAVTIWMGYGGAVAQSKKPAQGSSKAAPAGAARMATPLQKKIEAYLRRLYGWGPDFHVKVGLPAPTVAAGYSQVQVEITLEGQTQSAVFHVSADGRHLLRGDIHDMSGDPFAANRAAIRIQGSPARGPATARVTVVEYSDFQCPSCREMNRALRQVLPKYPQVRFVFKDFPLIQAHPWAMTAAKAGRCVWQQKPEAFWKFHDDVFDQQESIKPDSVWQKMIDIAVDAGLDEQAFRACVSSPETQQAVQASIDEAMRLNVGNTPTTFVNGRRIVGPDQRLLEQLIQYELANAVPLYKR